jgi:hypothetical protein
MAKQRHFADEAEATRAGFNTNGGAWSAVEDRGWELRYFPTREPCMSRAGNPGNGSRRRIAPAQPGQLRARIIKLGDELADESADKLAAKMAELGAEVTRVKSLREPKPELVYCCEPSCARTARAGEQRCELHAKIMRDLREDEAKKREPKPEPTRPPRRTCALDICTRAPAEHSNYCGPHARARGILPPEAAKPKRQPQSAKTIAPSSSVELTSELAFRMLGAELRALSGNPIAEAELARRRDKRAQRRAKAAA